MTAEEVKAALYARHVATRSPMPGPWTVLEEYRGIDLLAIAAWSSFKYERVGYEVKVSRGDLRYELLRPYKRAANVAWCDRFYLAVPVGLLTDEELAYVEPEWSEGDFVGPRCPGFAGQTCVRRSGRKSSHYVRLARPSTSRFIWEHHEILPCPTCGGTGRTDKSRVEREAPKCWVPRDIGLVVVDGRGTREVRRSPRREAPRLGRAELGQLVRWVSIRPDPRHHPEVGRRASE